MKNLITGHAMTFAMKSLVLVVLISFMGGVSQAKLGDMIKKAGETVEKSSKKLGEKVEETADEIKGEDEGEAKTEEKTEASEPAKDPDTLAKEADKELRDAERLMFNGKKEEAVEGLKGAAKKIKDLKTAAPEHAKLKTLESRADKLKGDLERRTGQTIDLYGEGKASPDAKTGSKSTTSETKTTKSTASSAKMPYHANQKMQDLKNMFRSIDSTYRMVDSYKERNDPPEMWLKKLDEVEEKVKTLQPTLDEAKAKAAEEGVTEHPEFDEAQVFINEQPKRLEEARKEATSKAEANATASASLNADVEALAAVVEKLDDKYFNKISGFAVYANDLKTVVEFIDLIEEFEKNEMENAAKALNEFAAKYGKTKEEVDNKMDELNYTGDRQPHFLFETLDEGLKNVPKSREAEYAEIIKRSDMMVDNLKSAHDFFRLEIQQSIRDWMAQGLRVAIDKEKAKADAASYEQKIAEDMKAYKEKLKNKEWPGNSKGKDAEAALKYFKESPDWAKRAKDDNPRIPLGVHITGDWSIQKRDLLGNPIMYGLPVYIAVQVDSEKKDGLVRVYNVTMRTEEMAGAKKEPPFTSITVGDSWFILEDKIK